MAGGWREAVGKCWPLLGGWRAGFGIRSFQKKVLFSRSYAFFSKELNVLAFFYVLYKRTLHYLRSFMFFIKEPGVLCILLCSL